ncbi:hypothetical protein QBC45DRAFT_455539 [Copromyces sp. CBS 386.78]|nr:hypothetical protein QBC45DRAFT_455539 [Copromyces sp. CBS 386.78]
MGAVFDRGLDDSAENAAPVSGTCTVPLTPSPAEWARHTLHKLLESVVGFWEVWLASLQKPPIPPTVPDDEERKRRAFADVDEFTVTTHERSLCKKTKAERERAWRL